MNQANAWGPWVFSYTTVVENSDGSIDNIENTSIELKGDNKGSASLEADRIWRKIAQNQKRVHGILTPSCPSIDRIRIGKDGMIERECACTELETSSVAVWPEIQLSRQQSESLLKFLVSRQDDIRQDIEDLGTLEPLLTLLNSTK